MSRSSAKIAALGEIALRVRDLDAMQTFYSEVIGLQLMQRFQRSAFFRIADGHAGHTQILALFDRSNLAVYAAPESRFTTVDHVAFTIGVDDFADELQRLRDAGLDVNTAEHAWVQWRSLYVKDPEGNIVELVCFDPSIRKEEI